MVLHGYQAVKQALVDLGEEFPGRGSVPVFVRITNIYSKVCSQALAHGICLL